MQRLKAKLLKRHAPKNDQQSSLRSDNEVHVIHDCSSPSVDILAVHGAGGHFDGSWTDRDTGFCWLTQELPLKYPEARILSFGYRTNSSRPVQDIATSLVQQVVTARQECMHCPLVIIAHSFGGMLIKGALAAVNTSQSVQQQALTSSIAALLLFGSPPNMAQGLIPPSMNPSGEEDSLSPALKHVMRDAKWLRVSNSDFDQDKDKYKVYYFTETHAPAAAPITDTVLLTEEELRGKVIRLNKTHGAMIRPAYADDEDLLKILLVLDQVVSSNAAAAAAGR